MTTSGDAREQLAEAHEAIRGLSRAIRRYSGVLGVGYALRVAEALLPEHRPAPAHVDSVCQKCGLLAAYHGKRCEAALRDGDQTLWPPTK